MFHDRGLEELHYRYVPVLKPVITCYVLQSKNLLTFLSYCFISFVLVIKMLENYIRKIS